MRPLIGTVKSNKKTGLRVKLESGLIIVLPYNKNLNIGEKILIKYNFTKNKASGILNSYSEDKIPEPEKELDLQFY